MRRFEPEPHGAGVGRAVSGERNQPEKLLPGRVQGKIYPYSCGRRGCARAAELLQDTELRVAEIAAQVGLRKSKQIRGGPLPGSSVARRWNIAEGHGSIEPCPFLSDFKKRYTSAPFSRTGHSRPEAPPCGGRGRPAPSAPPGCPAGPHGRPPAPRCGRPRPQYASGGR